MENYEINPLERYTIVFKALSDMIKAQDYAATAFYRFKNMCI